MLETRIAEHIPKYVLEAMDQPDKQRANASRGATSSIARHLIESGHKIDPATAFSVVLRHHNPHQLRILEALLIGQKTPTLCVQKRLTFSLHLPWL